MNSSNAKVANLLIAIAALLTDGDEIEQPNATLPVVSSTLSDCINKLKQAGGAFDGDCQDIMNIKRVSDISEDNDDPAETEDAKAQVDTSSDVPLATMVAPQSVEDVEALQEEVKRKARLETLEKMKTVKAKIHTLVCASNASTFDVNRAFGRYTRLTIVMLDKFYREITHNRNLIRRLHGYGLIERRGLGRYKLTSLGNGVLGLANSQGLDRIVCPTKSPFAGRPTDYTRCLRDVEEAAKQSDNVYYTHGQVGFIMARSTFVVRFLGEQYEVLRRLIEDGYLSLTLMKSGDIAIRIA